MAGVTLPPPAPPRPVDVDTGFWLWLAALLLLLTGQVCDTATAEVSAGKPAVIAGALVIVAGIGAVVLTLILLMRSGQRWARTVLTSGGVGTILYTALSLFGAPRETVPAVIFAVTGIVGSVLIGGGIYLLHRPDSQRFFVA